MPVAIKRRRVCHFCKKGRTGFECTNYRKAFPVLCFAPGNGYGGVEGTRDMEVDDEDRKDEEDEEGEEDEEDEDRAEGEDDERGGRRGRGG